MRILAIDLGARRVGLALGDDEVAVGTAYDVLEVCSPERAIDLILEVIKKESVDRLIVGLPLNMDDTLGAAARQTIAWAGELGSCAGKEVLFVDERLSSFQAEQQLGERKRLGDSLTQRGKKNRLDALAAADFLQGYLDGRLKALPVSLQDF